MTPIQQAAVAETLKLAGMFRQNAALKHGVPGAWGVTELSEAHEATAVNDSSGQPSPGVAQPPVFAGLSRSALAGWVLATSGLTGIGGVTGYLLNRPTTVIEQPASGSLLQWLEDTGQHVPPEVQP